MSISEFSVGIYTLGCKVNQYESEVIAEAFAKNGARILPALECCDVYVINTCTVTAESDRKARQFIRRAIRQNPSAYVLVIGCFSQVSPDEVAKIEGVDYIAGNANKLNVIKAALTLLKQGKKNATPVIDASAPESGGFEQMRITRFDRTRAYVKIEDGCENKCAYCVIPSARGSVRSKAPDEIIKEVRGLVDGGCPEIVLTGIETASYGKDLSDYALADLLCEIDRIPNIGRVRLGSLDPSLMRQDFVDRIASLSSLAPHFHLSMQSASDKVLALMKRKYNRRMALEGMERLRKAFPSVQFTTDMIVGFPQETEEDFAQSLSFIKEAGFLMVHTFPYSKRKGTVAATMSGQIEESVKHERVASLLAAAAKVRKQILDRMNGKTVEVLFETYENQIAYGHTAEFIEIAVPSNRPLCGSFESVLISSNDGTRCFSTFIDHDKGME